MPAVELEQATATIKTLAAIPPFPPIATKLLQLVSDEDVRLHRVVELIRSDAGFSSELLQLANSPLHALTRQVDSLQQALVVIGLDGLKRMVVTVASHAYARDILAQPELYRWWRHMLACGLLSEEIARACSIDPDQAYTAGLMHDAGRLGLLVAVPNEYAQLLRNADHEGAREDTAFLLECEREIFGIDHCEAGQKLAEKWGLPETFALIAGRHHDRHYGAEFTLLDVVGLACRTADSLGFDVIRTNCPWTLEQIRAQLPERARDRFWGDPVSLRESVLERLENLDRSHSGSARQDEPIGARTAGYTSASAAHPSARPQSAGNAPPDDIETKGIPPASAQGRVDGGHAVSVMASGAVAARLSSVQPDDHTYRSGYDWAPVVLVATALIGLLVLLMWDPLRAS